MGWKQFRWTRSFKFYKYLGGGGGCVRCMRWAGGGTNRRSYISFLSSSSRVLVVGTLVYIYIHIYIYIGVWGCIYIILLVYWSEYFYIYYIYIQRRRKETGLRPAALSPSKRKPQYKTQTKQQQPRKVQSFFSSDGPRIHQQQQQQQQQHHNKREKIYLYIYIYRERDRDTQRAFLLLPPYSSNFFIFSVGEELAE